MRILLLADIHANWPALSAIDEAFDACLFLGDAVDYATSPGECIDWLRKNAAFCIRGNHDHSVAQRVTVRSGGTFRRMSAAMRDHHFRVLNDDQLTWLARLPVTQHITLGGQSLLLVHATPRDPMDEYLPSQKDQWQARVDHLNVDFVCVGHTHVPMDLDLGRTRIINPGSVGQPRDGDPRAAYAIIDDGHVIFRRVAYDVDRTLAHMAECGIDPAVIRDAAVVLKSGGCPAPGTASTISSTGGVLPTHVPDDQLEN